MPEDHSCGWRLEARYRRTSARASVIARDEIFSGVHRTCSQKPSLFGFHHDAERTMTKMTFVAAALVAAAAYATEASAARSNVASRQNQPATATNTAVDCVRAPNVGAYATAPYSVPPCMPNTAN
jgi:hypothetical protein